MLLNSQSITHQYITHKYIDYKYHTLTAGLPLMVKLLEKAGPINLLKDDIPTVRKKMLWGREQNDHIGERAIKICSLFDTIAITDPEGQGPTFNHERGKKEAEYIAEKIVKIDYDLFYEKIQFFKKKQIVKQYRSFIQVCPKPLSCWLAKEFIEESQPETLTKWLTEMETPSKASPPDPLYKVDSID